MFSTRERLMAFVMSDPQLWNEILKSENFKIVTVTYEDGKQVTKELVLKNRFDMPGDEFVVVTPKV